MEESMTEEQRIRQEICREADSSGGEPEESASEPGASGQEPEESAPEPGASGQEPEESAPEPGASRQEPEESVPEPGASGQEPEESMPEPGASAEEPKESAPTTGSSSIDADKCEKMPEEAQASGTCPQNLLEMITDTFPGKRQDIRSYSALSLAYIGDVVYDLIIRTVVVSRANRPVNDLHRITVRYVSAGAQSKIVQALAGSFTEEEEAVYRRGKNSKPHTTAKNASVADYMKATGFEAVLGYLYLTGDMERALYLVKKGIQLTGLEL